MRTALIRRGVPPASVKIMLASISPNTMKQYDVYWKKWFSFCNQLNINLYVASSTTILNFFTFMYNHGCQYGSLNSCRAALSLILGSIVTNDVMLSRFLKGVFRLRPPLPKYETIWDSNCVLNFLEKWHPHDDLLLEKLTRKCITLLALVTTHRVQTLSKINIKNIEIFPSQITIKIPDLIKTSRIGNKQPVLLLPFFNEKPAICPAKTLISYLNKTASLRKSDMLFISYKKPHAAVSIQTLSRWIKLTLRDSGIDVSIFSAHSTRHASTSQAYKQGVNIDLIRKTAGWSGISNTFSKFYHKPIISTDLSAVAQAIIHSNQ